MSTDKAGAPSAHNVQVDGLIEILLSKNRQAVRQLKLIVNSGVEADLKTAQAFEKLSAGLTGAVNGGWPLDGADQAAGLVAFHEKGDLWQRRRALAGDFWTDGPIGPIERACTKLKAPCTRGTGPAGD